MLIKIINIFLTLILHYYIDISKVFVKKIIAVYDKNSFVIDVC